MTSQQAPLSLYIPYVHPNVSKEVMFQAFQNTGLGKIDHIDFVVAPGPNHLSTGPQKVVYRRAFIHFNHWFDNPIVKKLHAEINDPDQIAKLVYDDPWYWILLPNRNPVTDRQRDLPLTIQKLEDKIDHQNTLLTQMAETINRTHFKLFGNPTPCKEDLKEILYILKELVDTINIKDNSKTFCLIFSFLEKFFSTSLDSCKSVIDQKVNEIFWESVESINSGSLSELTAENSTDPSCMSDTSSTNDIPVVRFEFTDNSPIRLHVNEDTQNMGVEESKASPANDTSCTGCGEVFDTEGEEASFENSWECNDCWKSRIEQILGLRSGEFEMPLVAEMIRMHGRTSVEEELVACMQSVDAGLGGVPSAFGHTWTDFLADPNPTETVAEEKVDSVANSTAGLASSDSDFRSASSSDSDLVSARDQSTDYEDWDNISRSGTPDSLPGLEPATNN